MELTVGYAAGLIALGLFLGRQMFPTALAYILASILGHADSAATWTLSAPVFHQSYWPSMLRTDIAYGNGTRPAVQWVYRLLQMLSFLFAIAAVLTPLGLYQSFVPGKAKQSNFVYAKDESFFGLSTPSRDNYTFSRMCSYIGDLYGDYPCPFSNTNYTYTYYANGSYGIDMDGPVNFTVPAILRQIYSSGTSEQDTVTNFFDIQWRQTTTRNETIAEKLKAWVVGFYGGVTSVVLNNKVELIEGLIVDSVQGRIGFRNHTVPSGHRHGATWQEDILFVEPETACADTNLTLDFEIDSLTSKHTVLTDRGGFANMKSFVTNDSLSVNWSDDVQNTQSLQRRAEYAALSHNFLVALYYNITNAKGPGRKSLSYIKSTVNQSFPLDATKSSPTVFGTNGLFMSETLNRYLPSFLDGFTNKSHPTVSSNIFNITAKDFSQVVEACQGTNGTTAAYSGLVNIKCGMMRSVPFRQNDGLPTLFDFGSKWSQKMYTCASAAKVSIKRVTFTYNETTPSLSNLKVLDIQDKKYTDNASMPLWAVEDYGLRYTNDQLRLIWGLVSEYYQGKSNITTYRKPSLYLPGYSPQADLSNTGLWKQNMPGSEFATFALNAAYCNGAQVEENAGGNCLGFDTTGASDIGTFIKWLNLTDKAQTAGQVVNLRFTDFLASGVVGVKGVRHDGKPISRMVEPMRLKIKYHLPFAVPVIICAVSLLAVLIATITAWALKRTKLDDVRLHIQRLAPGRIFTTLLAAPEHRSTLRMSGKNWSEKYGAEVIDLAEQDEATEPLQSAENGGEKDGHTNIHIVPKS